MPRASNEPGDRSASGAATDAELIRSRLAAVLEAMADPLIAIGPDGRELLRNPAFDQFAERERVAFEGDVAPTPALPLLIERTARGERFTAALHATGEDGQPRWFEAVGRPFTQREGGGLLVIHDVSEQRLRRLQEEFVAVLAHELRTPLTAIQGYLQLVAATPHDVARYASLSLEQLERMRRLIADLFDTARIETGAMTFDFADAPLAGIVQDAVSLARTVATRHRITLQAPADATLRVRVDAIRLQQVLLNIMTNAIAHAPGADRIDVRLREVHGAAEIEVEDNGPGVPPDEIASIFDRFRQNPSGRRRTGGLGLGLFLAHQIVAAHGGTIDARSEPPHGLIMRIRLPLSDGAGPVR